MEVRTSRCAAEEHIAVAQIVGACCNAAAAVCSRIVVAGLVRSGAQHSEDTAAFVRTAD